MAGAARSPRRIVYVLERFPSGTLNFVYNEIRVLEREGFAVEIHSLIPGGFCPREAEEFAGRIRNVRPAPPGAVLRAVLHYLLLRPFALLGLFLTLPFENRSGRWRKIPRSYGHVLVGVYFAWLMRDRRDHIHAHFAFKAATAALVAARLNGGTFSFTAHGSATVYPPSRFHLRSKVRGASFVVAVSEFNRRAMLGLCPDVAPERIEVNRTGVLIEQFPPRDNDRRRPAGRILCVATLYPVKNHEGLVRACGHLVRRGVEFSLDLVGQDDLGLSDRLRRLAREEGCEDRIVFHGGVDHGEIPRFLENADVCVLSSFSEGVPVSLMEAMARGVPVVGPRVTGVPELVEEGRSGLLADPHDPASIADALEKILRDPGAAAAMADRARERIEEQYDMTRNAERLAGIFRCRLGGERERKHG